MYQQKKLPKDKNNLAFYEFVLVHFVSLKNKFFKIYYCKKFEHFYTHRDPFQDIFFT